jgi:hypothetical protein
MLRQLQVSIAALFTAMTVCSCNLDSGSESTSAEIDQILAERNAAGNAANQPAAEPSTAPAPSESEAKASKPVAHSVGTGTFLWKPISDNNGNLVVLLPSSYNGKARSVTVNGESGTYTGIHNGNRTHWRFSKPGAAYGNNVRVVATTSAGNASWTVPKGAARTNL